MRPQVPWGALNVTGDGLYNAVLNAPHHWKVE